MHELERSALFKRLEAHLQYCRLRIRLIYLETQNRNSGIGLPQPPATPQTEGTYAAYTTRPPEEKGMSAQDTYSSKHKFVSDSLNSGFVLLDSPSRLSIISSYLLLLTVRWHQTLLLNYYSHRSSSKAITQFLILCFIPGQCPQSYFRLERSE